MATKKDNAQLTRPEGLPPELEDLVVRVEEHKDGGWTFPAQLGLDITQEAVQEVAYRLMTTSPKASIAMMGNGSAPQNDDRQNKVSPGGDGRWFASTAQVRKAARAWAKAHPEAGGETWLKRRGEVTEVVEETAKAS